MRSLSFASVAIAGLLGQVYAAHHNVTVGKGGELKFEPEQLVAHKGDTIQYFFYAKNHSVSQSSFDEPCKPLDGGFFSAFTPNESEDTASPTTFTITVNETKPIWIYCGQGEHCQGGMVQSINAPAEGNTHEAFKEKAADAGETVNPEDGLPVGGDRVTAVEVGVGSEFIFEPAEIIEPLGTIVRFSFNPKNHSVTQSSFDEPCVPLDEGFNSGHIPTEISPSGVLFDIVVNSTDPIWFYCAQGEHCKNGMVGSINAPEEGNTHDAFVDLAAEAEAGQINALAPVGGILTANGTVIATVEKAVIEIKPMDADIIGEIPKPGEHEKDWLGYAGGDVIGNYSWPDEISDDAVEALHLLHFLDNILLRELFTGLSHLQQGGKWHNTYPEAVVNTIKSMAGQAWIHRATATDSLQHYEADMLKEECDYRMDAASETIDIFLARIVTLLSLEIGLITDAITKVAKSDGWLVPCLATSLGSKSRMAGFTNLMQGHAASAAPREVAMPADLVYAYAMNTYVDTCNDDESMKGWGNKTIDSSLRIEERDVGHEGRMHNVKVKSSGEEKNGWLAWIGPWGELKYTELKDAWAEAPAELYGHAWIVMTGEKDIPLKDLAGKAVAGPEMVWISQP